MARCGLNMSVSDCIDIRETDTAGSGVFVTNTIQEGQVLVQLEAGGYLKGVEDLDCADVHCRLILRVLEELGRGEKSSFVEYLNRLPESVPLPVSWTDDERFSLRGTTAELLLDLQLVQSRYNTIVLPLMLSNEHRFPEFVRSYSKYLWAHCIIESRAFEVAVGNEIKQPYLLPFIDMCNHSDDRVDAEIIFENASFQLRAIDSISQPLGQVNISYGELSCAQLLCKYGFVRERPSPVDHILVDLNAVQNSIDWSLFQKKSQLPDHRNLCPIKMPMKDAEIEDFMPQEILDLLAADQYDAYSDDDILSVALNALLEVLEDKLKHDGCSRPNNLAAKFLKLERQMTFFLHHMIDGQLNLSEDEE